MPNTLSTSLHSRASQPATKVWKAPVMQVVRAADTQLTTLNGAVDGVIVVGGIGITSFGS